jgi:hypothetical protein
MRILSVVCGLFLSTVSSSYEGARIGGSGRIGSGAYSPTLPTGSDWQVYLADDAANYTDGATRQTIKDWARGFDGYRGGSTAVEGIDYALAADGADFTSGDSGQSISGANGWVSETSFSGLVVFRPTDVSVARCMLTTGSHGTLGNFGLCQGLTSGAIDVEYYGHSYGSASGLISNGNWYCMVATKSPGAINTTTTLYLNGGAALTPAGGASTGTPAVGNSNYFLLGIFTGGAAPYQGKIAAGIMWKRTLTAGEAADAYTYVKARLAPTGVTLP